MNFSYSYRNIDGSVTVDHVEMTKAAYQHIHDSVMSECDVTEFIDMTMEEKDPERREKLYRKMILETYLEEVVWTVTNSYFWLDDGRERECMFWISCGEVKSRPAKDWFAPAATIKSFPPSATQNQSGFWKCFRQKQKSSWNWWKP